MHGKRTCFNRRSYIALAADMQLYIVTVQRALKFNGPGA